MEPGDPKNRQGRSVYLEPELLSLLKELHGKRRLDSPLVFHRNGAKNVDFRISWKTACKKAGIPGRLFHDLRRTAVRNMIRAGIPERVVMEITGHKTRAVFDRYNIVSREDLKEAAKKRHTFHLEKARQLQFSYNRPSSRKKVCPPR